MCKAIEDMLNETRIDSYVDVVSNVMKNSNLSIEQIFNLVGVPEDIKDVIASAINQ